MKNDNAPAQEKFLFDFRKLKTREEKRLFLLGAKTVLDNSGISKEFLNSIAY